MASKASIINKKHFNIFVLVVLGVIGYHFAFHPFGDGSAYARGKESIRQEQYAQAVKDFTQALREEPDNLVALIYRGNAYEKLGDFASALRDYNAVLILASKQHISPRDPRLAELYFNRGYAYHEHGLPAEAIADYRKAIELEPNTQDVYNNIAWILATKPGATRAEGSEAIPYAQQACKQTAWKDYATLDTLAAAYARAGDFTTAVDWQTKAIALADDQQNKAELEQHLALFRAKKAYTETPKRPGSR